MAEVAQRYRPPSAWLYYLLAGLARILLPLVLGVRIRRDPAVRKLRGPLLIIGNHPSFLDPVYMAVAMLPRRIHFLTSRIFFRSWLGTTFFRQLAAIPKIQFRTDSQAVKSMFRVIRAGGSLAVYPEGQRSLDGGSQPFDDAIAKLALKLACPVVIVKVEGGYLTWPRWSQSKFRPGRVEVGTRLLYTSEQLKSLDVMTVQAGIAQALDFQDYEWQKHRRHAYFSLAPALGLHNLCHQCPACGQELAMRSTRFFLTCSHCGNQARIDRFGGLRQSRVPLITPGRPRVLPDPYQWRQWQLGEMAERIARPDFLFDFPAEAEFVSVEGLARSAGSGRLQLTCGELVFTGDADPSGIRDPLQIRFPIRNMLGFSAVYGKKFELVLAGQTYRFTPQPGQAVVLLTDAIQTLKNQLDKPGGVSG